MLTQHGFLNTSAFTSGGFHLASAAAIPTVAGMTDGTENLVDQIGKATASSGRRPSWDEYFMATAKLIASRSNCERLNVGCVIVTITRAEPDESVVLATTSWVDAILAASREGDLTRLPACLPSNAVFCGGPGERTHHGE